MGAKYGKQIESEVRPDIYIIKAIQFNSNIVFKYLNLHYN